MRMHPVPRVPLRRANTHIQKKTSVLFLSQKGGSIFAAVKKNNNRLIAPMKIPNPNMTQPLHRRQEEAPEKAFWCTVVKNTSPQFNI